MFTGQIGLGITNRSKLLITVNIYRTFSDLAPALPHRRRAGTRTPLPSDSSTISLLLSIQGYIMVVRGGGLLKKNKDSEEKSKMGKEK